jgi:hypothetical protein
MKTNELIGTLPEHMSGNLSHSETYITLTLPDGYLKFDKVGDDLTLDGKELTREFLTEKIGKEKLREYTELEVIEEKEVSQSDILAAITDLNDRVDVIESGKVEPVENTGLWTRIKAVFTG